MKTETSAWSLTHLKETSSTQDLAIQAAQAGAPGRHAWRADRQTAGRGRDGRTWRTEAGNLHLSALLRPHQAAPAPAFWSLLAGIAVQQTTVAYLPAGHVPVLKWPNDVLLAGGKLAGVLIDSALTPAGLLDWVVIGVGVNLAHAPDLPDRRTACLTDHGVHITLADFAIRLLAALDHWAALDLPAIRAAWLARAQPPGTPLLVRAAGQVISGVFQGLAEDGALLLRGHAPIRTGEVLNDRLDTSHQERPGALPLDPAKDKSLEPLK